MRLREVAICPPTTTKELSGMISDLMGIRILYHPDILVGDRADSYRTAIRGSWDGEIARTIAVV